MHNPAHVSILIPARNEEELLPRCLDSIHRAMAELPQGVTSDVIVAVDRSTDRTCEIAMEKVGRTGAVITTQAGVVGKARALAAEKALQRYQGIPAQCWLANTDADCVVPAQWLKEQLSLAAEGFEVIAGTIDVLDFREHLPIVEQRFRDTYLIASDGSHQHVHGANLGIRADIYLKAGGWGNLQTGEDHDLWARASRLHARKLSVSHPQVVTSGRRVGRAPLGFAAALAAHNEGAA